jgi:hypothetical protein
MENVKKWCTVLDDLRVSNDEKIRKIISDYAEYHSEIENINKIKYPELQNNLLSSSLKVLSKLNLVNKNVIIKEDIPTIELATKIRDDVDNDNSIDMLIQDLINTLNKELETKDNLYITTVVNSVSIIEETDTPPYLLLTSRCLVQ